MKIAYFDCFAGASGDMILGALIDAGLDIRILKSRLQKLPLKGWDIRSTKVQKNGITGTKFEVVIPHEHRHRHLADIVSLIDRSGLSAGVKNLSKRIFTRLAEAEAKVHRTSLEAIHFHEVGAVDAIVDVVGACVAVEMLEIGEIRASRLNVGSGFVECDHGTFPVPAPATAELLRAIPTFSSGIEAELVTPTGAAVLSTLAKEFGPMPVLRTTAVGYGAGSRDLAVPNLLRVFVGESGGEACEDTVQLIETNIDDMNPQFYEHAMDLLFAAGARDVYFTPVIMKKNRPGILLSVVATPDRVDALSALVLRETTTLGVRISEMKKRMVVERHLVEVQTAWGNVRIKVREGVSGKSISPEYDDCRRIARENNLPIGTVFDAVKKAAESRLVFNAE